MLLDLFGKLAIMACLFAINPFLGGILLILWIVQIVDKGFSS